MSVRLRAFAVEMRYEDLIHAEMCKVASLRVKKNAPPNVRNLTARQSEIKGYFELAGYDPTLGARFKFTGPLAGGQPEIVSKSALHVCPQQVAEVTHHFSQGCVFSRSCPHPLCTSSTQKPLAASAFTLGARRVSGETMWLKI